MAKKRQAKRINPETSSHTPSSGASRNQNFETSFHAPQSGASETHNLETASDAPQTASQLRHQEVVEDTSLPSCEGSSGSKKRRGRGKGKGVKPGHGIHLVIYDNRFVTKEAIHEISHLFYKNIDGPWIKFSEYPKSELETLYARFKDAGFVHNYPDEVLRPVFEETIKRRYPDWISELRQPIFHKFTEWEDRYHHPPEGVAPHIWRQMVDKWKESKWQEKSDKNKGNRKMAKMFATTGSAPLAKYRMDMRLETGSEPDPIECFKRFHMKKDGMSWCSDTAKEMHEEMELKKSNASSQGSAMNSWQIYRDVVGEPSHGRVLGIGGGLKAADVYGSTSSTQGCSKRCIEDRSKEREELLATINNMQNQLVELKNQMPRMVADMLQSLGITQVHLQTPTTHSHASNEPGQAVHAESHSDNSFDESGDDMEESA